MLGGAYRPVRDRDTSGKSKIPIKISYWGSQGTETILAMMYLPVMIFMYHMVNTMNILRMGNLNLQMY